MFSFASLNDERSSSYALSNATHEDWDRLFQRNKNANRIQKEQQPPIDVHAKISCFVAPSNCTARVLSTQEIYYRLDKLDPIEKACYEYSNNKGQTEVYNEKLKRWEVPKEIKTNLPKCKNVEQQVIAPPVIIAKSKFSIYLDGFNTAYTDKYVNFVKPYECLTDRSYNDKSGLGYDGTSSNLLGVFLPSSEVLLPIIECSKADLKVKVTQLERYIKKQILHDFHPLVPFQGTKFQSYVNIKITFDRFRVLDYFSMTRPPDLD